MGFELSRIDLVWISGILDLLLSFFDELNIWMHDDYEREFILNIVNLFRFGGEGWVMRLLFGLIMGYR